MYIFYFSCFLSHILASCNQVFHWGEEDVRGVGFQLYFPRKDAFCASRWQKGSAVWWRGIIEKEFMLWKNELLKVCSSTFPFSGVCSHSHLWRSFFCHRRWIHGRLLSLWSSWSTNCLTGSLQCKAFARTTSQSLGRTVTQPSVVSCGWGPTWQGGSSWGLCCRAMWSQHFAHRLSAWI